MFCWYKYLSVISFFPRLCLWSGNFFLIVSFLDHCLLVPFCAFLCSAHRLMLVDIPMKFHHGIINGFQDKKNGHDLNACLAISNFKGP